MRGQPLQLPLADLQGPFCSIVFVPVEECSEPVVIKNVKGGNFGFNPLLGDVGCVSFASRRA